MQQVKRNLFFENGGENLAKTLGYSKHGLDLNLGPCQNSPTYRASPSKRQPSLRNTIIFP